MHRKIYIYEKRIRSHSRRSRLLTNPPSLIRLAIGCKRLCKLTLLTDPGTLPVEHVDWGDDHTGQTGQHGRRVLDVPLVADVAIHGSCVHGRDTGEQVTREGVTTSRGGRVYTVGSYHVVDGGEVDGVVGDTDAG